MAQRYKYEAIINLPHHVSRTRPQMSMADRAMQFGAFSPLVGYEDKLRETARRSAAEAERKS